MSEFGDSQPPVTSKEPQKSKSLVVGVKKKPDGSLDFSRAMTMLGNTSQPDSEMSEKGEPQAQKWLDQDREKANKNFNDVVSGLAEIDGQIAIRKWFLNLWNPRLASEGKEPLTLEDLDDLSYREAISASASEIAGQEIVRPVFIFKNPSSYRTVMSKITGSERGEAGVYLLGENFPETSILHTTGLIMSGAQEHKIAHEIRHSMDPFVDKRTGLNAIIDEAFAHYHETIVRPTSVDPNQRSAAFKSLKNILSDQTYSDGFLDFSPEQYAATVNKTVDVLEKSSAQMGDIETQRLLVSSGSIEGFISGVKDGA